MRKMKRTKKSAIVAGALAAVIAVSGAFAFLTDYDDATNKFQFLDNDGEQTIDIDLVEPGWDEALEDADGDGIPDGDADEDGIPDFAENVIYGTPVDKAPHVDNLGENDVYTFVTVLVPTKEVITSTSEGVWEEKASKELYMLHELDAAGWTEIGQNAVGEWAVVGDGASAGKAFVNKDPIRLDDNKVLPAGSFTAHVFAYNGIHEAGASTSDLFKQVEMINLVNGQLTEDDNINIYVDAYSVQASGQENTDPVALWKVMMNETAGVDGVAFDVFAPLSE